MLSGEGASPPYSSPRSILRGVERLSLHLEIAVDALGQALKIRVRDAACSEVFAPSVNFLNDASDFVSRLGRGIAEEFALRHGVGEC